MDRFLPSYGRTAGNFTTAPPGTTIPAGATAAHGHGYAAPVSFSVTPRGSVLPIVLALDVGSTGTRGGLFDATGRPLSGLRHKVEHQFTSAADGTSTIDPDQVVAEICEVIGVVLTAHLRAAAAGGNGRRTRTAPPVSAVGIDTFSSTLVGVDATGRAVTPCWTYADARCAADVATLRDELDETAVQQRTGTRLHTSYLAARFRWLHRTDPALVARVTHWMSLSEYVHLRLLGTTAAGTSVAAWTGLLNRHTADWDPDQLAVAGIDRSVLSPVRHPDQTLDPVQVPRESDTGLGPKVLRLLAEARWVPGFSDGLASNVGAGGTDEDSAVIAAATSGAMRVLVGHTPERVGTGLWCYRVDARRSLVGGALNDVGRAVSWLESTVRLPDGVSLGELIAGDPQPTTPLVLPFLTGERSTGWAGGARAVVTGLSAAHGPADLARGVVEGVALSYARVAAQLREIAGAPRRILASGRVGADLPALLPILADVLQAEVTPVAIKRSTLRGTAVLTLDVVAPDVPRATVETGPSLTPDTGRADHYAGRLTEFEDTYRRLHG